MAICLMSVSRHVGALLAISKTAAIVDGNVVAIAIALRPATSDLRCA
jgi:hypothetical protein